MRQSPWESILESLEPDIFSLTKMLNQGSPIRPFLRMIDGKWAISLEDCWDQDFSGSPSAINLDNRCEWVNEQLKSWENVERKSWQDWTFPDKETAEKFITFYNLIWQN